MQCPECGYPLEDTPGECPRCSYRRQMAARPIVPSDDPQAEATPEQAATSPPPRAARPEMPRRTRALLTAASLAGLLIGSVLLAWEPVRTHNLVQSQEARVRAIFSQDDGPCRNGEDVSCQAGMAALDAMRDHSDAALLRGDLRVAHYLSAYPSGRVLQERWRHDQISADELRALGDEAARRRSVVCRSFWMYAYLKKSQLPVPTLAINLRAP